MAARANVLECFDQVAGSSRGVPTMNVRIVSNQPDGVVGYAEGSLTLIRKPVSSETEVRNSEPARIGMLSGIVAAERVGVSTARTLTFRNSLPLMFSGQESAEAPFNPNQAEPVDVQISRDIWSRVVVSIRSARRNVETKFRASCRGGVLSGTGSSLTGDGEEASYLISLSVPRS
ncbi:MAG: hypothetical protein U0Q16_09520 [Bryobacteraceae bacterium]